MVVSHVDRRRGALEDKQVAGRSRQWRDALDAGRAGSDNGNALVLELVHRRAESITAGVGIIPPAGVKRLAFEVLDTRDTRQLGDVQRAGPHAEIFCGEVIATVGGDPPDLRRLLPFDGGNLGVEQRFVIQVVMLRDPIAMGENFRAAGIFLGRHIARLFEQRQVDHRGRVATHPGIAVPIPGAADPTGLVDQANVIDPGLLEPGAYHQAGHPGADESEGDMIGNRIARYKGCVRIGRHVLELAGEALILSVAIGAQALGALGSVFLLDRILVENGCHGCGPLASGHHECALRRVQASRAV